MNDGHERERWIAGGSVLAIMVMVLWWMRPDPSPLRSPLADSLDATAAHHDSVQAVIVDSASTRLAQSTLAAGRARHAEAAASALKGLADSLELRARTTDSSAKAWRAVAEARGHEADSLRSALDEQFDATFRATKAAEGFRLAYEAEVERRGALERLNASIRADIANMEPRCHVGPVRCPSRTQVALGVFGLDRLAAATGH